MAEYDNEDIVKTIDEGKKFINLVKDYSKLELIDKGSSIISMVILVITIIALSTIAIFCLCMALYHCIVAKTNDPALSYSIITLALLLVCLIIIIARKSLIDNKVIKYLSNLFFNKFN